MNKSLIHWGRVMDNCLSKLTIIGSDNGLSPDKCQAIIWTSAGVLLTGPLETNLREILIGIQTFSLKKMHLKKSVIWQPFCLSLNALSSVTTVKQISIFMQQQKKLVSFTFYCEYIQYEWQLSPPWVYPTMPLILIIGPELSVRPGPCFQNKDSLSRHTNSHHEVKNGFTKVLSL